MFLTAVVNRTVSETSWLIIIIIIIMMKMMMMMH